MNKKLVILAICAVLKIIFTLMLIAWARYYRSTNSMSEQVDIQLEPNNAVPVTVSEENSKELNMTPLAFQGNMRFNYPHGPSPRYQKPHSPFTYESDIESVKIFLSDSPVVSTEQNLTVNGSVCSSSDGVSSSINEATILNDNDSPEDISAFSKNTVYINKYSDDESPEVNTSSAA
eukprot:337995_1